MGTTMRCSVISFTVRVLGTATSMPDCRTGAVIMKMTSSTSTTSTMGVMLMSAKELRVWPLLLVKATFRLPGKFRSGGTRRHRCRCAHGNLFQRVQQFTAKIVDGRGKDPDPGSELVVGHHGRYGYEQAGSGGDQRLRDAGSYRTQRCCPGCAQAVKCVNYANDGAKEAHKRACGGDRGQPGEPAFQVGDGFAGGGLRRTLEGHQVARRAGTARLAIVGLENILEDLRQRAELEANGQRGDFLQTRGFAECANEAAALLGGLAERGSLAQDYGPGVDAGNEQHHKHGHGDGAAVGNHLDQSTGARCRGARTAVGLQY